MYTRSNLWILFTFHFLRCGHILNFLFQYSASNYKLTLLPALHLLGLSQYPSNIFNFFATI